MNGWVKRGLRTALLTGGFLAAGVGVAAADENDLTADLLGVTATVPVQDGAVAEAPVVTGTGQDLAVGAEDGLRLPVDTDTAPGTTVHDDAGTGGLSAPVRVTEAEDRAPDPADGLTVTVPMNTSGGGSAGTTVTAPIVTGNVGGVLDGDPLTGGEVHVDLDGPVTSGPTDAGLVLDLADTVTIGDSGATARDTVLEVPVSLDGDAPSTVDVPVPGAGGALLSDNDVNIHVGDLLEDGSAGRHPSVDGEPTESLPVDLGNLVPELGDRTGTGADGALTGNTVDVDLADLLGGDGESAGTVAVVSIDGDGEGTRDDNVIGISLPLDAGALPGTGTGTGTDDGTGTGGAGADDGTQPEDGTATPNAGGDGTTSGTGTGTAEGAAGCGHECTDATGGSTGDTTPGGARAEAGPMSGPQPAGAPTGDGSAWDPCAGQSLATQAASTLDRHSAAAPVAAGAAGLLAALLLAASRGRLWTDPR
ncbi:hypothetical protein [Blastococcus mobilis]|uniref:Small secreted domain n=1 Tax=Blastococcus mobilis TaxID=1938746 RepID=A0A238ZA59_9ACTN|nr:hypothetical protein [Blastococcus mobilis]SNR79868.1 hypothetical protein SAMN06272737_12635 [Blastococcus mobilis]